MRLSQKRRRPRGDRCRLKEAGGLRSGQRAVGGGGVVCSTEGEEESPPLRDARTMSTPSGCSTRLSQYCSYCNALSGPRQGS